MALVMLDVLNQNASLIGIPCSTTDHCVTVTTFTQKGVAWERLFEVRSEGHEVRDHQQLDNTQEERRVRKEQGTRGVGGLQLLQQDINIELQNNTEY